MSGDARSVMASGLTLAGIAAVCALLVAGTWHLTRQQIDANAAAYRAGRLLPALGDIEYDGNITDHRRLLEAPHGLPGNDAAIVYPAYRGGEPAAALFAVTARDGYAGPIRLLVGVDAGGVVTGVRVLEHSETPGFGDGIEYDRSDWARQFEGRSLGDPVRSRWAIRTDGGAFDQLTGASVTPRAVVKAVRDTLVYFEARRDDVFSHHSGETEPTE